MLRLHSRADPWNVDDTVTHHATVIEHVGGGNQPIAYVESQQAISAGTFDLGRQFKIPPHMIDVDCYSERAGARRIEPVANIKGLPSCVHAGTVGGEHWM